MKKIVWTFGLIAGGIMAIMMAATIPFLETVGDKGAIIGYTTMVVAFLMVYFGVRSYRDGALAGAIKFGKAFKVGILIALVASTCYVAMWEVLYHTVAGDVMDKYDARVLEKARAGGATEAQLAAQKAEMDKFAELYKNPVVNVGMTYLEVFPVGLIMVLVSAGALSRKKKEAKA